MRRTPATSVSFGDRIGSTSLPDGAITPCALVSQAFASYQADHTMALIYPDPERPRPLRNEASSRFLFGAALGLFIALTAGLKVPALGWLAPSTTIVLAVACVLRCGALAVYYGADVWG
jgi:hypothetical protein